MNTKGIREQSYELYKLDERAWLFFTRFGC